MSNNRNRKPMTLKRGEPKRVQIEAALDSEKTVQLFSEPTRMPGDPSKGIEPESDERFAERKRLLAEFAAVTITYRFGDPDAVEQLQMRLRRLTVEERDRVELEREAFLAGHKTEEEKKERRKKFPALFRADYRTEVHGSLLRALVRETLTELLVGMGGMDIKGARIEDLDQEKCIRLLEQMKWHELAAMIALNGQTPTIKQSLHSGP